MAISPPVRSVAPSSFPTSVYEWIFSRAERLTTGPTSVASSRPSPRRSFSVCSTSFDASASYDGRAGDDAAGGRAPLARRAECGPEDSLDCEVEVGVVHDDDRVLAAQLEVDVLQIGSAVLGGLDPHLARAREGDERHVGVLDEALADRLAAAVDDVEDAGGEAGLLEDLDEALAEHRRVARGLEHDGVSADERGRNLPARDGDGEVPRGDRADNADRLANAHLELVRHLRRRRLAEEAAALAGHVEGHVDGFLDVAARLGANLAHLAHHQLGQLVLALDEPLRDAEEDFAAPGRRRQAPALVGLLRRLDRAVDVVLGRARERADRLAGGGIRRVEGLVAGGVHPLAADVVLRSLCRCGRHLAPCRFSAVDSRRAWGAHRRPRYTEPEA